jgi:glycine cleavage system regulatory protein
MRGMRAFGLAGAVVLALTLAGGCSRAVNGSNVDSGSASRAAAGPAQRDSSQRSAGQNGSDQNGSGPGGAGTGKAAPGSALGRIVPQRALIKTADLSVVVDDVGRRADRAEQIADAAGGEVYADQRNHGQTAQDSTADLVLKVPPDALDGVLAQLSQLGREADRRTATQDVSEQVADVDSRVNSAKASLARLRALYGRAGTIGEITSLEGQLAQREADLESLQAQQRTLAQQTGDATVSLHLRGTAAAPVAATVPPSGFWPGLKRGWHAFAVSVGWLLTALGALLPFLVVAALAGYALWRVRRRRLQAPAAAPIPAMPPVNG